MNKLEIGMYVRTKYGIRKITNIGKDKGYNKPRVKVIALDEYIRTNCKFDYIFYTDEKVIKDIKKASFDIIDLIEAGDIVINESNNKQEVLLIDNELMVKNTGLIYDNNYYLPIKSIAIKSILTKEQFESKSYRIGGK